MQRLACHILGLMLVSISASIGLAAEQITPVLLTTFTNPTIASGDNFGFPVVAMGNDRVLIGASSDNTGANDAGAAYLFSITGNLLTVFTNPTPATNDGFGESISVVGERLVVIGAPRDDARGTNSGQVYLFNTNGTLFLTISNPTISALPGDRFGWSVSSLGNDRVLIGSPYDSLGASTAGVAYMYRTNGSRLLTFTNPSPATSENFGKAISALGEDRVVVGADQARAGALAAGAAYLFDTNRVLLATFTNPTPADLDWFGRTIAVVGNEYVLIGAPSDDTGEMNAGAAYLFRTNGDLVTTFTNPVPAGQYFGWWVTAIGSDKVAIGAPWNHVVSGDDAGAAYVFDLAGTLLTTLTNPTYTSAGNFGHFVAGMDYDRLLVGATGFSGGGSGVGEAFLFSVAGLDGSYPPLFINRDGSDYSLAWLTSEPGLILQQSDAPAPTAVWTDTPELVVTDGLTNLILQTVPAGVTNRFYRLRRP